MTTDEIMGKLTTIINDTFDSNYSIDQDSSAEDIDEWDSITHIELIAKIEEVFSLRFALSELQDLQNVGEMAKLIIEKQA